MKIYPEDSFEIDSSLTGGEIFALLDAAVEPPKWFRWRATNNEKYHGEVSLAGFKIWRIIRYRNSFLPIIEGKITPTISGSRIAVTMRLHRFVAVFMAFWLGGVTVFAVTFATAAIRGKMEPIPALLVPLVMLLFGIALTSGSFWLEANKTKPAIIELLKGKERKPARG